MSILPFQRGLSLREGIPPPPRSNRTNVRGGGGVTQIVPASTEHERGDERLPPITDGRPDARPGAKLGRVEKGRRRRGEGGRYPSAHQVAARPGHARPRQSRQPPPRQPRPRSHARPPTHTNTPPANQHARGGRILSPARRRQELHQARPTPLTHQAQRPHMPP